MMKTDYIKKKGSPPSRCTSSNRTRLDNSCSAHWKRMRWREVSIIKFQPSLISQKKVLRYRIIISQASLESPHQSTGIATLLSFRGKLELKEEHSWWGPGSWLLHMDDSNRSNGLWTEGCRFDPWIKPSLEAILPEKRVPSSEYLHQW